jgi:23S rRNA (adenine2503-C2)-methyltransferase
MKKDLKSFTRTEIKGIASVLGFQKYRGDQIFEWIYKGARTIDDMKNLAAEQKETLKQEGYYISSIKAVRRAESKLDGTVKYLFELEDKKKVESVFLPGKERNSLCISSQVGCACNCGFCATGELGFTRDLTAGEIISQFMYPIHEEGLKIDNIVFMGMGEPLLNWENVKKTIENLNDEKGFHFSRSRITVSTIGILPVMKEIADAKLKFKLAVSIVTPDPVLRTKLIPMNTKYPLADIVKMCKYYNHKTEQPVMVEYPLFSGVNDSLNDAEALHRLMNGVDYKLNIIPYNSVDGKEFHKPERETALKFQKYFMDKGIMAFTRKEKGADIAGACGQLAGGH